MKTNLVAAQWTIKEIERLYIKENYSMTLVSKITHIPIAELSRLLWKFGLPDKKKETYGPNFNGELNQLPKSGVLFSKEYIKENEENLEDTFFSGL